MLRRTVITRIVGALTSTIPVLLSAGCVSDLLPSNIDPPVDWIRRTVREGSRALLQTEDGVDDAFWLEVQRPSGAGTVGGYISPLDQHNGALVLLFDGAGTYQPRAGIGESLATYRDLGAVIRSAGFLTWVPVLAECGTPYGEGDLADALDVLDWLDGGGKAYLGVQRVYIVGYSTGATVANLVNFRRSVTAIVSLAGLTEPDEFAARYQTYEMVTRLFPDNIGMCQLADTMAAYGSPGSPGWENLDSLAHLAAFRNPTYFVQGTADIVYSVQNQRRLEARYRDLGAPERAAVPPLEFEYIPGGDHWAPSDLPEIRTHVVDYLMRFEPGRSN